MTNLLGWGCAAIALVMTIQPVVMALPATEVSRIAQKITVLIDGQNPGSGVLVHRQGNTYYVLTAQHVVATPDEYDILTADGQKYPLDYQNIKKFSNVDLALEGFSGDPVLDKDGLLVGIHGCAEVDASQHLPVNQGGNSVPSRVGINLGIPINTFLTLAKSLGLTFTVAVVYDLRGNTLAQAGRYQEALLDLRKAAELYRSQGNQYAFENTTQFIRATEQMTRMKQQYQDIEQLHNQRLNR